ncbi:MULTISPECIES: AraC family transcriptional regulator [Amycolatopsis]|uniref:AraC-type DNA-binding protein n=2 Tax=Amycolatopsis TaxID=1813 RepID=A0A1I3MQC2_9PSEU|nr:AraC family transcriptional regulator [Amycolatopsis sacchari]SFI99324.1 AraC-type DNA-binding protein [Amycolatopsis sacchari]
MDPLDELRALVLGAVGVGGVRKVRVLDDITLTTVDEPLPPRSAMTGPSFAVVAQGVKRTTLNGIHHDYHAGQYLVVPLDLPVTGQALVASPDAPLVVLSMTLNTHAIAPLLLETGVPAKTSTPTGLATSDASPELLDPVVRLLRVLDRPDDLRVLAPGYRREILWRLLTGEQGPLVRQIGTTDGHLGHIARAIRWLRENYAAPVSVAELAKVAGMSESTFHRHFRSATSMTPIEYRQQIRLQRARVLLAAGTTSVAEAGYLVGYESASQFNREYRRAFGVSPGAHRSAVPTASSGSGHRPR